MKKSKLYAVIIAILVAANAAKIYFKFSDIKKNFSTKYDNTSNNITVTETAAQPEDDSIVYTVGSDNSVLHDNSTDLMDEVYSQIKDGKSSCTIYNVEREEYEQNKENFNYYVLLHPELFWIGYNISMTYSSDKILNIDFKNENFAESDLPEMIDIFQKKIDMITDKADPSWSTYEKVMYIHDYLTENTYYDEESLEKNDHTTSANAYECLINGKALCSGYSAAFKVLADSMGIESGIVNGDTEKERHAWNYVLIDGEYYWLDVTWDDPTGEDFFPRHDYFLMDDKHLLKNRTIDENLPFVPSCVSMKENYFVKNNLYFETYNFDELYKCISAHSDEKVVSIMIDSDEEYRKCCEDLIDNRKIGLLLMANSTYSSEDNNYTLKYYSYSIDDINNIFTIYPNQ